MPYPQSVARSLSYSTVEVLFPGHHCFFFFKTMSAIIVFSFMTKSNERSVCQDLRSIDGRAACPTSCRRAGNAIHQTGV